MRIKWSFAISSCTFHSTGAANLSGTITNRAFLCRYSAGWINRGANNLHLARLSTGFSPIVHLPKCFRFSGATASLNVAVAGSIVLHHFAGEWPCSNCSQRRYKKLLSSFTNLPTKLFARSLLLRTRHFNPKQPATLGRAPYCPVYSIRSPLYLARLIATHTHVASCVHTHSSTSSPHSHKVHSLSAQLLLCFNLLLQFSIRVGADKRGAKEREEIRCGRKTIFDWSVFEPNSKR